MQHVSRSPAWALVALLLALFLAYDLGAGQARSDDWAALSPTAGQQGLLMAGKVLRIQYIPDPNDIVNLVEGTPYTVPAGMVLIITDWVTTDVQTAINGPSSSIALINPRIRVNGIDAWGGGFSSSRDDNNPTMTSSGTATLTGSLRSGVRVNAGDVVTMQTVINSPSFPFTGVPTTFASGYLAKAQ